MSKRKGREGFTEFYSAAYGSRWADLEASLLSPVRQVARLNRFAQAEGNLEVREELRNFPQTNFAGSNVLLLEPETRKPEPQIRANGVNDLYIMDPASIFAAAALENQQGETILDLCAAPGGKSLILAQNLGADGTLTSNEMSDRRRARLRAVIDDYIPADIRTRVKVTGHDGTRWCLYETDAYDRILLDAPCSGERHLLSTPEEMKVWSPARSKNLAVRQYALLASALAVVKPGGRIVYSTCSISPLENDAVIARLMKKRAGEAKVLSPRIELGEPTEHGWMILPDRTGYGPIYFAAIERT